MTTKNSSNHEPNATPARGETDTPATDDHEPIAIYRRFVFHAVLIVLALAALGFLPTRRMAGDVGLIGMAAALVADLAASVAGTLPIWWSRRRHPSLNVGAQLGAMGLRLAVVLLLGTSFALSGLVPVPAFLVWLVIGHTGLLVADTIFARSITAHAMQHAPTLSRSSSPAKGPR